MAARLTALAAAVLILSGCGGDGGTRGGDMPDDGITEVSTPQTRLLDAKEDWNNRGFDDYDWRYRLTCFCPLTEVRIEVRDGEAVRAVSLSTGKPVPVPQVATMEDLFDVVEKAQSDSFEVDVHYDTETGAVTGLNVDHIENAIDDEYAYKVLGVGPR